MNYSIVTFLAMSNITIYVFLYLVSLFVLCNRVVTRAQSKRRRRETEEVKYYYKYVRVHRYRLHYMKHYIISLSDNRTQRDDKVWFYNDKCREKSASVSTCCNIYKYHASVENLGSLHDSVTSAVGPVQDTISSCRLHPRCVPWTGHVPWILYEDADDYCNI